MRRVLLALLLALLLAPTPALAGPDEQAKAGELFESAETEYQAGRFQQAIDLLLEAQRIAPDPVLDYNLARAYEGLGNLAQALASYRAYLVADPDTRDRGAVEARIKTLDALQAERAAKSALPQDAAPKQPPASPAPSSPSAAPWVIAGVGALGLGAAGALGGLSLSRSTEAEDPATSGADTQSLHDEASSLALGANIAFGIGGAVLAAGVIWGIVDVVAAGGSDAQGAGSARVELSGSGARLNVRF